MTEVAQFHNLAHIFISLVGATLLMAIYINVRARYRPILEEDDSYKRVDQGLLFLSLALCVWVTSGIWAYLSQTLGFADEFSFQVGVHLLSILNNMFFLLALYYFNYAPSFIYNNKRLVRLIIIIIAVVTLATLAISRLTGDQIINGINLYSLPDLILSGFVSYLLTISLYKTFFHRDLPIVAVLSVLIVALIFTSQLPEVFPGLANNFSSHLIKIIAKTSLISIFLVLATTWVIQLAHTPKISEMQISFQDWSLIRLDIPSKNLEKVVIDFRSKTTQYKNLLKFAIRRKFGSGSEQSILIGSSGEIKNQTYLTRISRQHQHHCSINQ